MKVRNGFVSNSSSSSFTMILSKADHDAIVATMPEDLRCMVPSFVGFVKLGDAELAVLQRNSGDAFEYEEESVIFDGLDQKAVPEDVAGKTGGIPDGEIIEAAWVAYDAYRAVVRKLKVKNICMSLDL